MAAALAVVIIFVALRANRTDEVAFDLPRPLDTVVTAARDGRILLLDAADGSILRVLATGLPGTGGGGLTRSPDGKTIYFVRLQRGESDAFPLQDLAQVSVDGGPVTTLADGLEPAVSPNGRYLAYLSRVQGSGLVVRDLATGAERSLATPKAGVSDMTWLSDSRRLATTWAEAMSMPECGPDVPLERCTLRPSHAYIEVIDTKADPSATPMQLMRQLPGGSAVWITRGPHPNTVACLEPRADPSEGVARMMTIEADDPRKSPSQLLRLPRPVIQAFVDPSGGHVLYLRNSALYRRSGSETHRLAERQLVMTW